MSPKARPLFCWLLFSLAAAIDPSDLDELRRLHAQIETQQFHLQSQIADIQRQQFAFKQRLVALSARGASAVVGVEAETVASELKAEQGRSLVAALDTERVDALQAHIEELEDGAASIRACIDYVWLLLCGALVMSMQAGFAMLEAGTCRRSSAGMVLLKNIMDAAMGAILWFMFGYALAYGTEVDPNEFIGTSNFFGSGFGADSASHRDWFFQWAFCATSATIVSGAVAERIQFRAYIVCASFLTAFVYPVVAHWVWSGEGFLAKMGFSDFAGSGVVHLTGGTAALVSAAILGPRAGRFDEAADVEATNKFVPNDLSMVVLGTLLLWFGWYGFNCGSTLSISTLEAAQSAALVAMNTTLSAAAGGLTVIATRGLQTGKLDMARSCNGILAGLVSVCAACDSMDPGMAIVTGSVGGLAMVAGSLALLAAKIDDPLDAVSVHGCGGIVGVLLRPLVDSSGVQWELVGPQCLGVVCIVSWTGVVVALLFLSLRRLGMLNVSEEEEKVGCDVALLTLDANAQDNSSGEIDEHEPPVIAAGTAVVVRESFLSNSKGAKAFYKCFKQDLRGVVRQVDDDGDARIDFGPHGVHWVLKKHFINLRGEDPETKSDDSRQHSLELPIQKDISSRSVSSTMSPSTERVPASRSTSFSMPEDDLERQRSLEKRAVASEEGESPATAKSGKCGDGLLHLPARVEGGSAEVAAAPRKQRRPPKISVDDSALAR